MYIYNIIYVILYTVFKKHTHIYMISYNFGRKFPAATQSTHLLTRLCFQYVSCCPVVVDNLILTQLLGIPPGISPKNGGL